MQAKTIAANPGTSGFLAAFTSPMVITGLGEDLLDLHLAGRLQRPGDHQDLHRRQDPDHRQAELRRRQHLDQRPALRRPVQGGDRQRGHPVPGRLPRPGPAAHAVRQAEDGLPQLLRQRGHLRRRRRPGPDRHRHRPDDRPRRAHHQRRHRGRQRGQRHPGSAKYLDVTYTPPAGASLDLDHDPRRRPGVHALVPRTTDRAHHGHRQARPDRGGHHRRRDGVRRAADDGTGSARTPRAVPTTCSTGTRVGRAASVADLDDRHCRDGSARSWPSASPAPPGSATPSAPPTWAWATGRCASPPVPPRTPT